MLKLRNSHPSLARGRYEAAAVNGPVLSFQRRSGRALSLVVINYGGNQAQLRLQGLPPHGRLQTAFPARAKPIRAEEKGRLSVSVPAKSLAVYDLRP